MTITGTSGVLSRSVTIALAVTSTAPPAAPVSLAAVFNVTAIVADGVAFTGVGLDTGINGTPTAYSANLLGAQQTVNGATFTFGPANALDAVSGRTVPLSAGQFSSLKMLATAVNGNQTGQAFTVTYTDGTSTTFSQSLSDWFTPQNYAGESKAMTMPYRDTNKGVKDNRPFQLYFYAFTLNPAKKVSSITLPATRNVVVLAMSVTP